MMGQSDWSLVAIATQKGQQPSGLTHADRMLEEQMLSYGAAIGYYSGDVRVLVDDIQALKPTVFIGVPRVYDKIYAGVISQINNGGGLLFAYTTISHPTKWQTAVMCLSALLDMAQGLYAFRICQPTLVIAWLQLPLLRLGN